MQGIHGKRRVRPINGIAIEMFGSQFKIDRLLPLRLHNADLIIGLSFFESFVLQIDYPNSRLRIISHDTIKLKDFANVRMKKSSGSAQPIVKVNLNDEQNLWFPRTARKRRSVVNR